MTCGFAVAQTQTRKASSSPQSDLKPVYERWVDEDVAYIITPEEKRAFLYPPRFLERDFLPLRQPSC